MQSHGAKRTPEGKLIILFYFILFIQFFARLELSCRKCLNPASAGVGR